MGVLLPSFSPPSRAHLDRPLRSAVYGVADSTWVAPAKALPLEVAALGEAGPRPAGGALFPTAHLAIAPDHCTLLHIQKQK